MFELTTTVSLTTKRQKEIKALYIDAVWNPFTSTVMNEDVKPRIITAYKNVLIPYLLDEVEHNLSCKKVSQLSKLYNGVYDRMLELREEETNKLERKLRKEKDPIVVLDLFTIKIKSSSDL